MCVASLLLVCGALHSLVAVLGLTAVSDPLPLNIDAFSLDLAAAEWVIRHIPLVPSLPERYDTTLAYVM